LSAPPKLDENSNLILSEGRKIVDAAQEKQLTLRLMGAAAIATHSPKFRYLLGAAGRRLTDLDFMGHSKDFERVKQFMETLGYKNMRAGFMLAAASVGERSIYVNPTQDLKVDVFFDQLRMSHTIDFRKRLNADRFTISLADLLLEKMQIVHINEKDLIDTIVLLCEHEVGSKDEETINADYISSLLAQDWGFYYTATQNLNKVKERTTKYPSLTEENRAIVLKKVEAILQAIESKPKSSSWKIRARIGTRKKWYEDVEEVVR
jgi:hypothetical protein